MMLSYIIPSYQSYYDHTQGVTCSLIKMGKAKAGARGCGGGKDIIQWV